MQSEVSAFHPVAESRRTRRPVVATVAFALASGFIPGEDALGYRFFWRTVDDSPMPVAADAARWDPAVWGPGQSLPWTIAASPGWTEPWEDFSGEEQDPPFASLEAVIPFAREALEAWSAPPGTDIEWSVAGLGGDLHAERDHLNAVRVHPFGPGGSYADVWDRNGVIVECDVSLSAGHLEEREEALLVLIHEFGHCLGLDHAALHPTWDTWSWRRGFGPALWDTDAVMSYGYWPESGLTQDDLIGASLLRPARGWPERVGSIEGRVTVGGRPARYVPVFASRISGEDLVASAHAFTNGEGSFAIEGLSPGDYLLAAGAMGDVSGNISLVDRGASLGSTDQYLLDPVRVTAGQRTSVPPIPLREGREASPWLE